MFQQYLSFLVLSVSGIADDGIPYHIKCVQNVFVIGHIFNKQKAGRQYWKGFQPWHSHWNPVVEKHAQQALAYHQN